MKKVFMIHGFLGRPNGGWRPWLMAELNKDKIYACSLPMPTPEAPQKAEWVKTIGNVVGDPNEEIFLVGHSLGAPAILRYLESLPEGKKIGGAILVSSPSSVLNPENKESKLRKIDNFLDTTFNYEYIKQKSKNFCVVHGENDDKVSLEHAKIISESLGCEKIIIPNMGHLDDNECFELPETLQALLKMIPPSPFQEKG